MSYFILCDGKNYQFIGTAQDHKRVGEGDKGKNTGEWVVTLLQDY